MMQSNDPQGTTATYFRMMEAVPTQVYLGAALGSIALSALLRLVGKKDAAIFVGQWPPTFILFALAFKVLYPSHEDVSDDGHAAVQHASDLVGAGR
jgi:Na+-transporting NADH:ubiquinone oxidoreductase subunit NqrB